MLRHSGDCTSPDAKRVRHMMSKTESNKVAAQVDLATVRLSLSEGCKNDNPTFSTHLCMPVYEITLESNWSTPQHASTQPDPPTGIVRLLGGAYLTVSTK